MIWAAATVLDGPDLPRQPEFRLGRRREKNSDSHDEICTLEMAILGECMGRFPYEEGTANQKQAQGHEAGRTGLWASSVWLRASYIFIARSGQEGHHVLRQSDKPSLSACPAGEKQVRIDVQTRVLVNKTYLEVSLFKTKIPAEHTSTAVGRRSIWVERSQSVWYNLKSSNTEN